MRSPKHQFLIASCARDLQWLAPNLCSLQKFASGWALPPAVVCTAPDLPAVARICRRYGAVAHVKDMPRPGQCIADDPNVPHAAWKSRQGFLRAQIVMMSGDVYCPEADFVWLLGSDCFLTESTIPVDMFVGDKPIMVYQSYTTYFARNWQEGVKNILGFTPENEFMQWLPIIYPTALYPAVRKHIEQLHKAPFEDVIYGTASRNDCSESNILGAYAFAHFPEMYHWHGVGPGVGTKPDNAWTQWWSHGGLDRVTTGTVSSVLPRFIGRTPRAVMTEILGHLPAI